MRRPRANPCINLRFSTIEEMDNVELHANQDGLPLQSWIRQLVRQRIRYKQLSLLIASEQIKAIFRIEIMLESLVDEATLRRAKDRAEYKFNRLELKTGHNR